MFWREVHLMLDYELLEKLCRADGIAGREDEVRELILCEIGGHADSITIDNLGNILVFKKGARPAPKKLLISAHMDEVGFIVTYINDDGTLQFAPVGGINSSAVYSRRVRIGEHKIRGVVNTKPVHLTKSEERKEYPDITDYRIDIGADSREEAEAYIQVGDMITFDSIYEDRHGRIISKALDDRVGCLVLIELIKSELPFDMYFSFVVQEEIGLRGAKAAAFTIAPDSAIVVEGTTASDLPGIEGADRVCLMGGGAVVSLIDGSTIYDRDYYRTAMDYAAANGIKAQTKSKVAGGNDAGAIHVSRGGVRTAAVSVPCRYIHSASSIASKEDIEAVYQVVRGLAEAILGKEQDTAVHVQGTQS